MSAPGNSPEPPGTGRVPDAAPGNWVDGHCPRWSLPYLRLSRVDRPIGTWLLLIPCWWGLLLAIIADGSGGSAADVFRAAAFAVGAILMRGAGCTWNDISDRRLDAMVARTRTRPIPSGQVSVRNATVWMCVQGCAAFAVLLTFNPFSILLGVAALVPAAVYPFAKRFTWWPQVFLGIAFNWGALIGWSAHAGGLGAAPVLLYLAGISWTLFYDTIYAHQDRKDDILARNRSTAMLFAAGTHRWLAAFAVVSAGFLAAATVLAIPSGTGVPAQLFAGAGVAGFCAHMAWQLRRLDIDDPDVCLNLFWSNRDAGLILAGLLLLACLA